MKFYELVLLAFLVYYFRTRLIFYKVLYCFYLMDNLFDQTRTILMIKLAQHSDFIFHWPGKVFIKLYLSNFRQMLLFTFIKKRRSCVISLAMTDLEFYF